MVYETLQISILILIFVIIGVTIPYIVILLKNFYKYQTRINNLLVRITFCFGFGSFYDFLRVSFFIFSWYLYPFADKLAYCVKFFLYMVALYYEARLMSILMKNARIEIKHEKIRKVVHLVFIATFFIICLLTIQQSSVSPSGLFTYATSDRLFWPLTVLFVIVFVFLGAMALKVFKNAKEGEIKKRVGITLMFFGLLTSIGYVNIRNFIYIPWDYPYILFYSIFIIALLGSLVISFLKFPELLEVLNLYFNVSSLYLIKENGEFIFSHDLIEEGLLEEIASSRKEMLGGFIYAISRGVGLALKIDAKVNLLDFGDFKLVIEQGNFVYGVLLINEYSPILEERLIKIIYQFESKFKDDIINWNGKLSDEKKENIKKLIYKLLR